MKPINLPRWLCGLLAGAALLSAPAVAAEPPAAASAIPPLAARAGRARPVVVVVGLNAGTETTDFVVPYGILAHAGVAEVLALATGPGPITMRPALTVEPHATIAQFDERFAEGADLVVVPAVAEGHTADPVLLGWLRAQAAKGATIASICDGALVVANAGLFKGRRATGHWATQSQREREHPDTRWLTNVRYVADGPVVSSAGVSAAIPTSLALVEALGGRARAQQVAQDLGAAGWGAEHDSTPFKLGARHMLTYAANAWFSRTEDIALPLRVGDDEIALALAADAWSRTYRSQARTVAATAGPVRLRHGLRVVPDRLMDHATDRVTDRVMNGMKDHTGAAPASSDMAPLRALDRTLDAIARRYGKRSADFVSLQLEYPWTGASSAADQ